MSATRRTLCFGCAGEVLYGVLDEPADGDAAEIGVVVVVGGPQYRAGSHRQFTLLARACAAAGIPALRFDVRGMGDSTGERRAFDALDDDVAAAVDALCTARPRLRQVVLWGLCDGASAALLYAGRRRDPRIAGLVLLNPWVRSEQSLARTHARHYYVRRIRQAAFWRKLLSGQVPLRAPLDWLRTQWVARRGSGPRVAGAAADTLPFTARMAAAWRGFRGPMLLVLSGDDYVAKEFLEQVAASPDWAGCMAHARLTRIDIAQANHTFSAPPHGRAVETATLEWLQSSFGPARRPADVAQPLETPTS